MKFRYLQGNPRAVLIQAAILVAVIAAIDWRVDLNLAFGFLYLFPMLLLGTALPRWQVVLAAIFCTLLSDVFDPFRFTLGVALPEDILVFTSLAGTGLFAHEITQSRRKVEAEAQARREAEEQLEFLIGSSSAAILTMDADGIILRANSAAHRLFGSAAGQLKGRNIRGFVPALARVPSVGQTPQTFRTEMQCRGERENGAVFLANVFFSTYQTAVGPRLAALVVDGSDDLREREEANLEQLLAGSRILVGAVSHEIRNVCGAMAVIHENLVRSGTLAGSQDFEALGSLVETLNTIASLELKQTAGGSEVSAVDLAETLDDLRIVLEPYCEEAGITVHWDIPRDLPPVLAERHRLLQVLLNLIKNSERALEDAPVRLIDVLVAVGHGVVSVRVNDSGPGIGAPERLFQPFQKGADSTGLGLYLSRAFVRSFRGDLRYDNAVPGCSFVIELAVADEFRRREHQDGTHSTVAAG